MPGSIDTQQLLHLLCAAAVGLILGLNRDLKGKPIGMRTLGLVAVSCCVLTQAALQLDFAHGEGTETAGRAIQV